MDQVGEQEPLHLLWHQRHVHPTAHTRVREERVCEHVAELKRKPRARVHQAPMASDTICSTRPRSADSSNHWSECSAVRPSVDIRSSLSRLRSLVRS
mmetsp:Transcript_19888/g.63318  ORF Transcript_19888/g.63318 Transcript_19888/m.63318 type:complete len:97 (-) Transcript_19888:202-492(-)